MIKRMRTKAIDREKKKGEEKSAVELGLGSAGWIKECLAEIQEDEGGE